MKCQDITSKVSTFNWFYLLVFPIVKFMQKDKVLEIEIGFITDPENAEDDLQMHASCHFV